MVPVSAYAEPERQRQPEHRPEDEGAVDEADDRVGDQVGRVALFFGRLIAEEDPADVGVEEAADRTDGAAAMADVGAVGVALGVGEAVVAAVVGDPLDHRALERHRAKHRPEQAHRRAGFEGAMGEEAMKADRDPEAERDQRCEEDQDVLPDQRPPQDCQIATAISASGTTVTARLATRSIGLPAAGMPATYS